MRGGHARLARCRGRRGHGPVAREVEVLRAVADVDVAWIHVVAQVLVHLANEVVEALRCRRGERRRLADDRGGVAGGFEHCREKDHVLAGGDGGAREAVRFEGAAMVARHERGATGCANSVARVRVGEDHSAASETVEVGCGQPTVRRAGRESAHLPVAQVIGHHNEEVGPGRRRLGRSRRLGTALWLAAHNDTVEDRGAFVGGRPLLATRSQARAAWDAGIGRRSELEHICRLRCAHGRPNGCIAAAVPHWELIVAVWEQGARRNAARRARGQPRVAYKRNHRAARAACGPSGVSRGGRRLRGRVAWVGCAVRAAPHAHTRRCASRRGGRQRTGRSQVLVEFDRV